MLAAQSLSLSLNLSPVSTARPAMPPCSRQALADSTNVNSHSSLCSPAYPKSCVYPTSSTRSSCSWEDSDPSASTSTHLRHPAPPLFPVTFKAPPTVSISLSAACSQSIPRERLCGSPMETDLPDVRSVVPFPSVPSYGDTDVDMHDGTSAPRSAGHLVSARQTPRKRHSAHSSIASSPGGLGKDAKQKRPRKSKRQVTELWWLGVVHRSILRGIEVRQVSSDKMQSRPRELDAMDHVLVEKIQRRLTENGCADGRALPNPLPRISSPSISVPSLNLVAPSRKSLPAGSSASLSFSSELDPQEGCNVLDGTALSSLAPTAPPSPSLSIGSHFPTPSTSHRRHVRFQSPPRLRHPIGVLRRSPSPPARTGSIPAHGQTLTLTMPQLVASLTLAYHDRSALRLRGRSSKMLACGKNSSVLSECSEGMQCSDGDPTYKGRMHASYMSHARLSCAPERKSPLSRVVYSES